MEKPVEESVEERRVREAEERRAGREKWNEIHDEKDEAREAVRAELLSIMEYRASLGRTLDLEGGDIELEIDRRLRMKADSKYFQELKDSPPEEGVFLRRVTVEVIKKEPVAVESVESDGVLEAAQKAYAERESAKAQRQREKILNFDKNYGMGGKLSDLFRANDFTSSLIAETSRRFMACNADGKIEQIQLETGEKILSAEDMQKSERQLVFSYRNYKGDTTLRRVLPLRDPLNWGTTDWHPEPGWLLDGIDLDKMEIRRFALKDCDFRSAEVSEKSAEEKRLEAFDTWVRGTVDKMAADGFMDKVEKEIVGGVEGKESRSLFDGNPNHVEDGVEVPFYHSGGFVRGGGLRENGVAAILKPGVEFFGAMGGDEELTAVARSIGLDSEALETISKELDTARNNAELGAFSLLSSDAIRLMLALGESSGVIVTRGDFEESEDGGFEDRVKEAGWSAEETEAELIPNKLDARCWVEGFNKVAKRLGYSPMDEGWLLGWFSNCFMAGFDHSQNLARHIAFESGGIGKSKPTITDEAAEESMGGYVGGITLDEVVEKLGINEGLEKKLEGQIEDERAALEEMSNMYWMSLDQGEPGGDRTVSLEVDESGGITGVRESSGEEADSAGGRSAKDEFREVVVDSMIVEREVMSGEVGLREPILINTATAPVEALFRALLNENGLSRMEQLAQLIADEAFTRKSEWLNTDQKVADAGVVRERLNQVRVLWGPDQKLSVLVTDPDALNNGDEIKCGDLMCPQARNDDDAYAIGMMFLKGPQGPDEYPSVPQPPA